jgi:hypothetical protein
MASNDSVRLDARLAHLKSVESISRFRENLRLARAHSPVPRSLIDHRDGMVIMPPDEMAPRGEIAADNTCEHVARPAEAALRDGTEADLRSLDTAWDGFQSKDAVPQLPQAASLPPVPGLPVLEPVIDRRGLDKMSQPSHSLPGWVREHQAPPLRKARVFLPRAIWFLVACGIAAPAAYYYGVAMSAVHEQPIEVSAPQAIVVAQRRAPKNAPEAQDQLHIGMALTELTPGPNDVLAPEPPDILSASPMSPAATTGVGEVNARPSPPTPARPTKMANAQDMKLLIDHGQQFFEAGDVAAARILFLRAANAGDAAAAVAMGATYDPIALADRRVLGVAADLDKARNWYERAKVMGSPEGPRRLRTLANR